MTDENTPTSFARPTGYLAIFQKLGLKPAPIWHESYIGHSAHRIEQDTTTIRESYPASYWPGDELANHLEFALKYDGVNMTALALIFNKTGPDPITCAVLSKPLGKYSRRLWFLYEFITGIRLPIEDIGKKNYVDLLEPDRYVVTPKATQVSRQKINNNLLGVEGFCPTVRRTKTIDQFINADLSSRCRAVIAKYPPKLLARALSYLYTKETKSSFEIEHVRPDSSRAERFVGLLHRAEKEDFCDKDRLIELQNKIVDPRYVNTDYRTIQNFVGETTGYIGNQNNHVHFVCPKPDDLPGLMAGLIAAHHKMKVGEVHPVVHAAVVAYGFVFLHPFEDGNGRIHRFLIHNILARSGFTSEGLIFPVSAVMLKHPRDYDRSLEAFSTPLLSQIDYTLDEQGRMTVQNDTAFWYRFIDMTPQVEALFGFIEQTIETELKVELDFLVSYDKAKTGIQNIADIPDRLIDLFIRFCLQNQGKLSQTKRTSHFEKLTDDEISRMENVVNEAYGS